MHLTFKRCEQKHFVFDDKHITHTQKLANIFEIEKPQPKDVKMIALLLFLVIHTISVFSFKIEHTIVFKMHLLALLVLLLCVSQFFAVPISIDVELGSDAISKPNRTFFSFFHFEATGNSLFVMSDYFYFSKNFEQWKRDELRPKIQLSVAASLGVGFVTAFIYLIHKLLKVFRTEFNDFNEIKI